MTGAGKEPLFPESAAVNEVISKPFTLAEIDETIQSVTGKAIFCMIFIHLWIDRDCKRI